MKIFKYMSLSTIVLASAVTIYAKGESSEFLDTIDENRVLRRREVFNDLSSLPHVQAAKCMLATKRILKENYEELTRRTRRQQRAEKEAVVERNKQLKKITKLKRRNIDTLNVVRYMEIIFMYPEAYNRAPKLVDAIIKKANAISNHNPINGERKAAYITALDGLYGKLISGESKHWKNFDMYGCRQVVKSAYPRLLDSTFDKPKDINTGNSEVPMRQFAKRMKEWNAYMEKLGIPTKTAAAA